jgi:hypothetical protein
MGPPDEEGAREGGEGWGRETDGASNRHSAGEDRSDPQTYGDHWGKRPPAGIPHPRDVELIEDRLAEAFEKGDPTEVWALTRELLTLSKAAVVEAARARFKVNFGGSRCERCDGLKAGPGVEATCFQVKQCYFGNIKESEHTLKQRRVIRLFLGSG